MMKSMFARMLACLALVAMASAHAQEYTVRAEPAWVDTLAIPAKDQATRDADGTRWLLVDDQVDITGTQPQWYHRVVYGLELERALADGGQFNIDFHPEYQRVQLHAIDVIRDGQRQDRIASARVQELRREDDLESGILDGRHTLNITVPDLQVGDVVDYRYSVVGANPIFGKAYYDTYGARFSVAMGARRVRAIDSPALELQWRAPKQYTATTTQVGNRRVVDIRAEKVLRVRGEDDMPGSYDPWGRIELTTAKHWRDIVQWSLPLYPTRFRDRALAATLVDRLKLHDPDKAAALRRAVAYVQGEIRYTALDMGQNSHAPYAPEETVSRRFGDCKDKATLLAALLAEAGIEAHPVLVNTEETDGVRERAPSGFAFDHVVTRARLEGRDVWIDATRDRETGALDARTPLPFKLGLPICAGCEDFVAIPDGLPAQPDVEVGEVIALRDTKDGHAADFTIVTDYRNGRAVAVLDRFEDEDVDSLAEEYLGYMRNWYEGTTRVSDPVAVRRDDTRARLTERYALKWKSEDSDTLGLALFQLDDYLPELADKARRAPLQLSGPRFAQQTIRAKYPGGWAIEDEKQVVENRWFRFERSARVVDGDLVIVGSWKRAGDVVPAADYAAFRKDVEKVRDLVTYDVDLDLTAGEVFNKERAGWPIAAVFLASFAGFYAWRTRDRTRAAGMLFRPRATVADVLASPNVRVWTGLLLIALATTEVLLGEGSEYIANPTTGFANVALAWGTYFLKFAVFVALLGIGFRLLSAPVAYRNLFVATVWSVAPPIVLGSVAAIVAMGGDVSLLAANSEFDDGRALEVFTAAFLLMVATGWAIYASINSYSATANVSRRHAIGAVAVAAFIGLFAAIPVIASRASPLFPL